MDNETLEIAAGMQIDTLREIRDQLDDLNRALWIIAGMAVEKVNTDLIAGGVGRTSLEEWLPYVERWRKAGRG